MNLPGDGLTKAWGRIDQNNVLINIIPGDGLTKVGDGLTKTKGRIYINYIIIRWDGLTKFWGRISQNIGDGLTGTVLFGYGLTGFRQRDKEESRSRSSKKRWSKQQFIQFYY